MAKLTNYSSNQLQKRLLKLSENSSDYKDIYALLVKRGVLKEKSNITVSNIIDEDSGEHLEPVVQSKSSNTIEKGSIVEFTPSKNSIHKDKIKMTGRVVAFTILDDSKQYARLKVDGVKNYMYKQPQFLTLCV